MSEARCFITNNPIGTDTHVEGHPCTCLACEAYAEGEREGLRVGLREAAAYLRRRCQAYGHPDLSHADTGLLMALAAAIEALAEKGTP